MPWHGCQGNEAESAPRLRRIKVANGILSLELLALEEFGHDLNLLQVFGTPHSLVLPASFQALARAASEK